MQEDFYKDILMQENLEVITPNDEDMNTAHDIIYNELCLGEIKLSSKEKYIEIINKMQGIEGVILGCTEIGLLISSNDLDIKVFDTAQIHAKKAVEFALE